MIKLLEILRMLGSGVGIFLAYYYGDTPEKILNIMNPWVIGSIAGLSGIEGLFFAKQAAKEKGFEQGSNYQRQSAMAFLSIGLVALLVYFSGWGLYANLSIAITFLLLITLSAINHTVSIFAEHNLKWQNVIRPIFTIALLAAYWCPIYSNLVK